MKLESLSTVTKEVYVDGNGITVTATPWGNLEGVSVMVHGDNLALRMAGAFRWEELDVLLVALAAARGA